MVDFLLSWWTLLPGAAVLGAVAWYFPPFRKLALTLLGVLAAAKYLEQRGANRVRKEWQDAERRSVEQGRAARERAELIPDDPGVRDRFDRDNK